MLLAEQREVVQHLLICFCLILNVAGSGGAEVCWAPGLELYKEFEKSNAEVG